MVGEISAFNTTYSPNYEIAFSWECLVLILAVPAYSACDLFTAALLAHITCQLKLLQNCVSRLVINSYNRMIKVGRYLLSQRISKICQVKRWHDLPNNVFYECLFQQSEIFPVFFLKHFVGLLGSREKAISFKFAQWNRSQRNSVEVLQGKPKRGHRVPNTNFRIGERSWGYIQHSDTDHSFNKRDDHVRSTLHTFICRYL